MKDLIKAVNRLIESVADDNNRHGGLLSRDTTRHADECRVVVNRMLKLVDDDRGVNQDEGTPE